MMITQYEQLVADLRGAGIGAGMVLMVHSSFKSLGFTEGSPALVVRALEEVLTEEGTLLMPALTYANVTAEHNVFSVRDTPCCVGAIPEAFRQSEGVVRSSNPQHSVCAWGRYAGELTREHWKDKGSLDNHSPYRLLPRYGGKILMLGCGLRPNTFMHGMEDLAGAPYRLHQNEVRYRIIEADGSERGFTGFVPDMAAYIQRYDRVADVLEGDELRECRILRSTSYLMDAASLERKAVETIRRSPLFFVDKRS